MTLIGLCATTLSVSAQSPYIDKVYEYRPAPGQFVNTLPAYTAEDTEADMCRKALEAIGGTAGNTVTLGSFGGYITFGFDHTVVNEPGKADFTILGNSFFYPKAEKPDGGSSEPGVVMVSRDENANGLPDDTWYEIRGEAHAKATAGYSITYSRPDDGHQPVVSDPRGAFSDDEYIRWTANDGTSGYMPKLILYTQSYFPEWLAGEQTFTFTGTRLPDNAVKEGTRIKEWVLYPVGNGYADCYPNDDTRASIDISLATDDKGNPANLPGIDFVRVYTGQNQHLSELGETSTEITGAIDLHPAAGITVPTDSGSAVHTFFAGGQLRVLGATDGATATVYDLSGRAVFTTRVAAGAAAVDCPLSQGTYLIRCAGQTSKAIFR